MAFLRKIILVKLFFQKNYLKLKFYIKKFKNRKKEKQKTTQVAFFV